MQKQTIFVGVHIITNSGEETGKVILLQDENYLHYPSSRNQMNVLFKIGSIDSSQLGLISFGNKATLESSTL